MAVLPPYASLRLFAERLRSLLAPDQRPFNTSDYAPRHRGLVYAICFFTSALIWFTLSMRQTYTAVLTLPTRVENVPPGQALRALPASHIQVQIRGEGIDLLRLYYNRPVISLNASQEETDVREAATGVLQGVDVETVTPGILRLHKEARVTRTIPIRHQAVLVPPPGYDLVQAPRLEPDSVEVTGAQSILDRLTAWPTVVRTFDVKDSLQVELALLDTLKGLVSRATGSTRLTAYVESFTQGVRKVKIQVEGMPTMGQVTLEPAVVRVQYLVPISQYDAAQQSPNFYATVSYDTIRADTTGRVQPQLHLPPHLSLRNVQVFPATVSYYTELMGQ